MTDSLPVNVQIDLKNGFEITDRDDGYQRCRKLGGSVFEFKCDVINPVDENGEVIPVIDGLAKDAVFVVEEMIDVSSYSADELEEVAELGYDNLRELREECGDDAEQILAELLFEAEVPVGAVSASLLTGRVAERQVPQPSAEIMAFGEKEAGDQVL